jgi:DNA repair protein RecN (Recombination protein N)
MLTHIHVRDFAIVEEIDLALEAGMTVVTGETGAGKSIVIGALGLALGDKAEVQKIRAGCERAEVTLTFDASGVAPVRQWLAEQGLEAEGECLVRRVLTRDGRSRAYINDAPSSLPALRQLGEMLLDIHGQHAHQSLLRQDTQRELLDDFGEHAELLRELGETYRRWRDTRQAADELSKSAAERNSRLDLLRYQQKELDALGLAPSELTELGEEHLRLANVHQLMQVTRRLLDLLYEREDDALITELTSGVSELAQMKRLDARLETPASLLTDALIPLEEAASELRHYVTHLDADPERLTWVEQRLGQIHTLARKYRVSPEELPGLHQNLLRELASWEGSEGELEKLQQQLSELESRYLALAAELRQRRTHAAEMLQQQVSADMQRLGMGGGRFAIAFANLEQFSPTGMERVEFNVSTNPGQPLMPLSKVASGGELSRISLAIQVAAVQSGQIPTLVFDEVDVGIGGRVAEIVGQKLLTLARNRQVLCITHLPQVAALGQQHLQVSKHSEDSDTHIEIRVLSSEERIAELARMSGGVEITTQTVAHAKDLLERAQRLDRA